MKHPEVRRPTALVPSAPAKVTERSALKRRRSPKPGGTAGARRPDSVVKRYGCLLATA